MRAIVVGSGLLGLSSAFHLAQNGCEVVVVDRCAGPGRETSFANGGMLTPSMSEPWNAPGVLGRIARSAGRNDAALLVRLKEVPSLLGWGIEFLKNSSQERFDANTLKNVRLAMYSLRVMRSFHDGVLASTGSGPAGSLKLFRQPAQLEKAARRAAWLASYGVASALLTESETLKLEPALGDMRSPIAGAIHNPDDAIGDALQYCETLCSFLAAAGVTLMFDTVVDGFDHKSGSVKSVFTTAGTLSADTVVLAAGSYSLGLASSLGLRLPIRPAKGYSATLPTSKSFVAPRLAVVDDDLHAAVVPLGRYLRVAGTAEFAGFDPHVGKERVANLLRLLADIYPRAYSDFDVNGVTGWAGLRPMSADGVPIIGATSIENLFVNTGHGHLGWSMAAGSGKALADLVVGKSPEIELADYALGRFRSSRVAITYA